ncbi:MAG TPA: type II CAAX endopeptidase family protein, partial [Acidimicrobiales bacterium]|nr:type II CAAX endopeptidase family protein [Acidimicrobiales bacterium]
MATALVGRAMVRTGGDPRAGVVVGLILQNLLCIGLAVLFAAAHGKPRAADFGLQRPRLLRAVGLTIPVGVGLFLLSVVWAEAIGLDDDAPSIADRLVADDSTSQALLVLVMVAVAVPLGEEFVFRGYVFRALSNWRGTLPAAALTGVSFAATHLGWLPIGAIVPAVVFGSGLCLLYHWTGSLYPPLALHALSNSLLAATALGSTWQFP